MTTTCDTVHSAIRIGTVAYPFVQSHGCGHSLDDHTDGMKCRVCGRDCARADGQALDVDDAEVVGVAPGRLF